MKRTFFAILLLISGSLLTLTYHAYLTRVKECPIYAHRSEKHRYVIKEANKMLGFNLVDPEQAPLSIRESVVRGYHLLINTDFYSKKFGSNQLSCTNCHFCGGDTLGGKNGGISLVGVTSNYPQFSKRDGKVITLVDRMNNCFKRSMNGHPPAPDSEEMIDIINYLGWISKEVESIKNIPWLGLPSIMSKHKPDAKEGKKVYDQYCLACHQSNGEGGGVLRTSDGKLIPPIWGPNSFNDGAGMSTMKMMAPFVLLNMPYQQATLTEEQALDVTAYVLSQPRPHFTP